MYPHSVSRDSFVGVLFVVLVAVVMFGGYLLWDIQTPTPMFTETAVVEEDEVVRFKSHTSPVALHAQPGDTIKVFNPAYQTAGSLGYPNGYLAAIIISATSDTTLALIGGDDFYRAKNGLPYSEKILQKQMEDILNR